MLRSEVDLVRRYVPDLAVRYYALFGRLDRFILVNHNYERSHPVRRGAVNVLNGLDWALLSLPGIRNLAGTCVMHGRVPRSGAEAA
jgi:hypothetical protein